MQILLNSYIFLDCEENQNKDTYNLGLCVGVKSFKAVCIRVAFYREAGSIFFHRNIHTYLRKYM
jgi:hypothetical protein